MTKTVIGVVTVVVLACLGLPTLLLSTVMGGGAGECGTTAAPTPASPGHDVRLHRTGIKQSTTGSSATST
jgi:hypothetical protein